MKALWEEVEEDGWAKQEHEFCVNVDLFQRYVKHYVCTWPNYGNKCTYFVSLFVFWGLNSLCKPRVLYRERKAEENMFPSKRN